MTTVQYKRKLASRAASRAARLKLFAMPVHMKRNREAQMLIKLYRAAMRWQLLEA